MCIWNIGMEAVTLQMQEACLCVVSPFLHVRPDIHWTQLSLLLAVVILGALAERSYGQMLVGLHQM